LKKQSVKNVLNAKLNQFEGKKCLIFHFVRLERKNRLSNKVEKAEMKLINYVLLLF